MGRHPIVQQEDFSCLLGVPPLIRFKQRWRAEIGEEYQQANKTEKPSEARVRRRRIIRELLPRGLRLDGVTPPKSLKTTGS